jgi:hypothetical protein
VAIFLVFLGLAVIVIAVIALVRGHLDWARISSRKIGGGVLLGGFVVLVAGGIAGAATTPTPIPAPAAAPAPSISIASTPTSTSTIVLSTTTIAPVTTTTTTVPPTTTTTTRHVVATTHHAVATTHHTVAPTHTTKAAPVVTLSCSASVDNPHPHDGATVNIVVHTTAGADVVATAHYKSTNTTHEVTATSSTAHVPFDIGGATENYRVVVGVTVSAHGASRSCSTSFTPEKKA